LQFDGDFPPDEDITSFRKDYEWGGIQFLHVVDGEIKIDDISEIAKRTMDDIEDEARKLYKRKLKEKRRQEYFKLKKEFEE
jgi:hypothetical protein